MTHVAIRPLPYSAAGITTPVRVATICGDSVPPWDVLADGVSLRVEEHHKLCPGCRAALVDRALKAP